MCGVFGNSPFQMREVYASANRIATPDPVEIENPYGYRGFLLLIDITVDTGTDSVVFNIETECSPTDEWFEILDSASLADVGETVMQVYAGATPVADLVTGYHPGRRVRIVPVHTGTDGLTYSVHLLWVN